MGLLGMNQTKALGKWFAEKQTLFNVVISSTLRRADATAQAIYDYHPVPKPLLVKNPLIREQNFGIAEGHPYGGKGVSGLSLEELYAQKIFPHPRKRDASFPGGESRDDLTKRAERTVNEILLPHVPTAVDEDVHIAIVSHGLFIREIVDVLMKLDNTNSEALQDYRGLRNTGWTRITVKVRPDGGLRAKLTDLNRHEHLNSVTRQHGGIGSLAHDPAQKDIRSFFGGSRKS
ncbi:hypothetical protein V5O48_002868 [Marasmius crinis-equi]|uniref:Phosphoglycerate mutase n=1 Tax=Marasmius crinis-equi TaxID=585013 RepID=A0ABR3FUS8_9AGAR